MQRPITIIILTVVLGMALVTMGLMRPNEGAGSASSGTEETVGAGEETARLKMVWSDEFDNDGLPDTAKWSYDVGDGCPNLCGWGNNELEYYTKGRLENARVEDGNLIIEAHHEHYKSREFTSARLVSRQKGDWKYGRVEARMKLPSGKGTWPAFWMLPTHWEYGGWPESGEIDVMEHVGFSPDSIFGTVHTRKYNHMDGTHKGGGIELSDVEANFHIYAAEWHPDHIDFFVDDKHYFTFENDGSGFKAWPFDREFHVILNLAVGGNWGGKHGIDEGIWPQQYVVDYVRVFEFNKD